MARIIYSALVDSIQGSIKGTTFQRNAYGHTIKGKPNMVNPNTDRQNARKRTFSNATQAWRNLTGSNRAQWDAYANAFPIPSRKNPASFLSGLNAFTRWHAVRFQADDVVLANPSGAQGTAIIYNIELVVFAGQLHLLLDISTTNGPWLAFTSLTRPLQATQSFVKSWARYTATGVPASWDDFNINAAYVKIFGVAPVVGDLVGAVVVMLNTKNGQVLFGPAVIVTVTV